MRGRALVRFLIVITVVTGMMLAPVVTWPSPGLPTDGPSPAPRTAPVEHADEREPR